LFELLKRFLLLLIPSSNLKVTLAKKTKNPTQHLANDTLRSSVGANNAEKSLPLTLRKWAENPKISIWTPKTISANSGLARPPDKSTLAVRLKKTQSRSEHSTET